VFFTSHLIQIGLRSNRTGRTFKPAEVSDTFWHDRSCGGAVGRLQASQGVHQTRKVNMALTRDFKETVAARVQSDPAIAQALLDEAISLFVNGEPESAKLILRDLVNATIGFESLAEQIHKPAKSLHRMLSQSGNPTMSNISAVFAAIKRALKAEAPPHVVAG
jgi:DNA-binding phage protein